MRALPLLLVPLALLLATPPAAAAAEPLTAGCDIDDDLYNHCHVGPVHWVTGPACAGVKVGGTAHCTRVDDVIGLD